jgi:hypothetical protein
VGALARVTFDRQREQAVQQLLVADPRRLEQA